MHLLDVTVGSQQVSHTCRGRSTELKSARLQYLVFFFSIRLLFNWSCSTHHGHMMVVFHHTFG